MRNLVKAAAVLLLPTVIGILQHISSEVFFIEKFDTGQPCKGRHVILGKLNVVLVKYVKIYLAFESAECVLLMRRKVHSMSNTLCI